MTIWGKFVYGGGMEILTRLNIKARCRLVGEDEFGNRYYEAKKPSSHAARAYGVGGRAGSARKRYVLFRGRAEASKVPAEWHGWLHYMEAEAPVVKPGQRYAWQKPHVPNLTGTIYAYRPAGHLLGRGARQSATGDYQAWKPKEKK